MVIIDRIEKFIDKHMSLIVASTFMLLILSSIYITFTFPQEFRGGVMPKLENIQLTNEAVINKINDVKKRVDMLSEIMEQGAK